MKKLGLIAALPSEARCFTGSSISTQQIIQYQDSLIYVSGIGSENAAKATQHLIENGANVIISWGTAGSLTDSLQAGDVLLPKIIQLQNSQYISDTGWQEQLIKQLPAELNWRQGKLIQTEQVINNPQQKAQLYKQTQAHAVDMESGIIASIAAQHNLPFLAIRSIVDHYDESIPNAAIASVDQLGHTDLLALIINLVRKPSDLIRLIRLGVHFQSARKSLQKIAPAVNSLTFM